MKTTLTAAEKKWLARLKRALKGKPAAIELISTYSSIAVYPTGTVRAHMKNESENGSGIRADYLDLIQSTTIYPYPEQC